MRAGLMKSFASINFHHQNNLLLKDSYGFRPLPN